MKHSDETLAWLLAADEHPHLKQEQGYQTAKSLLDSSPDLQKQFGEVLNFTQNHPELFGFGAMPPDVKQRISDTLSNAAAPTPALSESPSPWSLRQQFAWAAVLALFLAGLSVLSSKVIEQQTGKSHQQQMAHALAPSPKLPEFHQFVSHTLSDTPHFQHQAQNTLQLVSWLQEHDGFAPPLPEAITNAAGMGCAILESPHGKISMLCVTVAGQKLKLYIACSKALNTRPQAPHSIRIDQHEAIEWMNDENVFLLIQSRPEEPMPEIML